MPPVNHVLYTLPQTFCALISLSEARATLHLAAASVTLGHFAAPPARQCVLRPARGLACAADCGWSSGR